MLRPLPDETTIYSTKDGRPSKDFYNWLKQLEQQQAGGSSSSDPFAEDFGAKGDGSTDDTAAILDGLSQVASEKLGTLRFRLKPYVISDTIEVNVSNLGMRGEGPDGLHDTGFNYPSTRFIWAGGAAPMVRYKTTYGPTASIIKSCRFSGIALEGNSTATFGLVVDSVRQSKFSNIFVKDVVTAAVKTMCGETGVDLGEAADTQRNIFSRIEWSMILSAPTFGAHGFWIDGNVNSDTSENLFELCDGQLTDGNAFEIQAADNNVFIRCHSYITGTGKTFRIYGVDAGGKFVDNNTFIGCVWSPGGCVLLGTDSGFTAGSRSNMFLNISNTDASDFPVLGDGCACVAIMGDGRQMGLKGTLAYTDAATYVVPGEVEQVLFGAACTVTLPDPDVFIHRRLHLTTQTATAIISDASNVQPITGGALGTAILPATAGKWADLQAFDSKWIKVAGN